MATVETDLGTFYIPDGTRIRHGDVFTISGVDRRNPAWRWWTFWRPKVLKGEPMPFTVTKVY